MPFTPFHMGPGILIKSILQTSFSLMVFGWTQILMDIQPLIVMIRGQGHMHGFTHTYVGATLIAIASAFTGKYLSEFGLKLLAVETPNAGTITWAVAFISAFIGSYSHVFLDSIMHRDIQPFFPFSLSNGMFHIISVLTLHEICLITGVIGSVIYFVVSYKRRT